MSVRSKATGAVVLLALTSCSSYQWFRSRERLIAESPVGTPAAEYVLHARDGSHRLGTVQLWSRGGWVDDDGAAVVHLGVQIASTSDATLTIGDDLHLQSVSAGTGAGAGTGAAGASIDRVDPAAREGELSVAGPDAFRRVQFEFRPPIDGGPRSIHSFAVRWRVLLPDGETYEQITPFMADALGAHYVYLVHTRFWNDF